MYTRTGPTEYSRPLDNHERLYVMFGAKGHDIGREGIAVTASLTITIPESWTLDSTRQRLRDAWQGLRFLYPGIALDVADGRKIYHVPSPTDLESWTDRTLHIYHDKQVTHDSLLAKGEIVAHVHLHALIGETEKGTISRQLVVVLRAPHYLEDVLSSFGTLDKFVSVLAAPPVPSSIAWGSELDSLPPSLEAAAESPDVATPASRERCDKFMQDHFEALPALGLPPPVRPNGKTSATLTASITFSREETASVIAACRAKGCTVNAAALTSIVRMQNARQPEGSMFKNRNWVGGIAMDLRPLLPAQKDPEVYRQGPFVTATHSIVSPTRDFVEQSRELSAQWKRAKGPIALEDCAEWARSSEALTSKNKFPLILKMIQLSFWVFIRFIFVFRLQLPPMTHVGLSSIGLIDDYVKPEHQVKDPSVGATTSNVKKGPTKSEGKAEKLVVSRVRFDLEVLANQIPCYIWTWNGQLELSCCFNSGFHNDDFGASVLSDWKARLLMELGVGKTEKE